MTELLLVEGRVAAGYWHGLLRSDAAPDIEVRLGDAPLLGVSVEAVAGSPGHWRAAVPIPPETIGDGTQVFLIIDRPSGARIGHFAISATTQHGPDLAAGLALLRADLDLLARAFRQHCRES